MPSQWQWVTTPAELTRTGQETENITIHVTEVACFNHDTTGGGGDGGSGSGGGGGGGGGGGSDGGGGGGDGGSSGDNDDKEEEDSGDGQVVAPNRARERRLFFLYHGA